MADSKRVCMFCGGTPVTLEHHFAQWIQPYVPAERGTSAFLMTPGAPTQKRGGSRSAAAVAMKMACGPCNNGWMRDIEDLARPILGPMILGRAVQLGLVEQEIISAWLVKSALASAVL